MESLIVEVTNPETVHAIAETAARRGTSPETAALELLEAAILSEKPFEVIVEPIARSFDDSGMTEQQLDEIIETTTQVVREQRHQNK